LRDDYVYKLNDNTLVTISIKISEIVNSTNTEFINSIVQMRGIEDLKPISKNQKSKVNFAIPTAGVGLLIVVLIKLFARTAGEKINKDNEVEKIKLETQIENQQNLQDQGLLKQFQNQSFQNDCFEISNRLFERGGQLRVELDRTKIIIEKYKAEGIEVTNQEKEKMINSLMQSMNEIFLLRIDSVLNTDYNKNLPQNVRDRISNRYFTELKRIFY
jgi:hypothetical protein